MSRRRAFLVTLLLLTMTGVAHGQRFTVAAASDLRYALDDVAHLYRQRYPAHRFDVVYGSSGKMSTQILNGAPYDVFFSADIAFPQRLQQAGFTASDPVRYAIGRIVIWSSTLDASTLTLEDLASDPRVRRIAIAQPTHAPYGQRAREALVSAGVWEAVQGKLVFGENIAHAAQMVESAAADAGIIALSLAKFPALARHPHRLIDEALHQPLTQGYVVTRRGGGNPDALTFADFVATPEAHAIMMRYGFVMPR